MSLNVMVSAKMMKGLEEMFQANTVSTVKMLAKKYEFNEEEALLFLNITEEVKVSVKEVKVKEVKEKVVKEKVVKEKKEKKEGPKMVLPFCGRVVAEWCEGVKMNHGLYSQCVSERSASNEKYCKSCKKQADGNESGKPNLGEISERLNMSSSAYREAKGKKCVVYAVVMKKLNIEKEAAVAEALKFGLEIPAEEFEMPKSQRGRPKKVSESDNVSSGSDEGEKKRRGRPKKNKTVAEKETDETDDLIASLVAEANALKGAGASEAGASEAGASEAGASEAGASEADEEEASDEEADEEEADDEEADEAEDETENKNVLKAIAEKIKADETFNTLYSQDVPKAERKAHLAAIDEHLKTLLTGEEMALYQSASTDEEEAEAEEEEEEEEDESTKKAREAAEKKAQADLEKQQKKEQADLEKKAKKEQADLEKKAKADLEKKVKAEADAEKKAQAELEKKAKKEQADAEKKAKKEQADLEKKAKADLEKQAKKPTEKKPVEKKVAEKKVAEKKVAEVKPVEKAASAELQVEVVEESNAATETVNAEVFEFEGKKYLKTSEGILYDQETEESVGVWNEETKSIDEFADDEE